MADVAILDPNFVPPIASLGAPASGGMGLVGVQTVFGVGRFDTLIGTSDVASQLQVLDDAVHYTMTQTVVARPYVPELPYNTQWMIGDLMFARRGITRVGNDNSEVLMNLGQLNVTLYNKFNELVSSRFANSPNRSPIPEVERLEDNTSFGDESLDRIRTGGDLGVATAMRPTATQTDLKLFNEYWALCTTGILGRWNIAGVLYLDNNPGNHMPSPINSNYQHRHTSLTLTFANKGYLNMLQYVPGATNGDRVFIYLTRSKQFNPLTGKSTYGAYEFRLWAGRAEAPPDSLLLFRDLGGRTCSAWWRCLGIVRDQRGKPPPADKIEQATGRGGVTADAVRNASVALGARINMVWGARQIEYDPVHAC